MWPLARWGLPVPALVIGSIAPDLFMVLLPIPVAPAPQPFGPTPLEEAVHFAHTFWGLLTADVAIGVAAFVAWQAFFAPALIAIAPKAWRARLPQTLTLRFGWWRVALAVLLGAATHLAWDSFTHEWMWGTQHIGWLAERHGPLRGFQWVQVASDVVGLAIVGAAIAAWWRSVPPRPDPTVTPLRLRVPAWLLILGPATVAFCLLLPRDSFYVAITTAAGLALIGLTGVAGIRALKP